ncbi:MAG: hypothetical protein WBD86_00645 [Microgenomates group bacterium]
MPISPEKEPRIAIKERAEEFELPPQLGDTGIKTVETAVKARVKDGGRHLIQTPATKTVTIKLPADQASLASWAKGSVSKSLTWLAAFWLRMIKKATHFSWRIIRRKGES